MSLSSGIANVLGEVQVAAWASQLKEKHLTCKLMRRLLLPDMLVQ
jgi:hypothetical protein